DSTVRRAATRQSIFISSCSWIASLAMTTQWIIRTAAGLTFPATTAISTPPGTSGLLAFEMEWDNDGYDTIKRWPRRPPQAASVPLLASRYPRDGSDPRSLCGCRDSGH